jgi:uncharacterized membrane protein YphA (DoxX/SURF4 family)
MNNRLPYAFDRFFFTKVHSKPLAIFRIGVAVVCLAHTLACWRDRALIWGPGAYVAPDINALYNKSWSPHLGWLPVGALDVVLLLKILALLGLLLGLKSRIMAVVAWFLTLLLLKSANLYAYGYDYFALTALFYCMLMPVGRSLSVDQAWHPLPAEVSVFYQRILQVHMCIVYLFAGLSKALGEQWWTWEAVWRSFNRYAFYAYDFEWLAKYPVFCQALGLGTLFFEITYCVAVWWKPTRKPWLASIIGMHLGIMFLMKLYYFGAIMIVFNLGAFWNGQVKKP